MTARIAVGGRVRHIVDPIEGVVVGITPAARANAPAMVRVQVDRGGEEVQAEGFWERIPGHGSMDRRAI